MSEATPSRDQIVVGAQVWLNTMRREFMKRYPDRTCTIPMWDAMPMEDRTVLLRASKAAIIASQPENAARVAAAMQDEE
jgi:hypothetical protein